MKQRRNLFMSNLAFNKRVGNIPWSILKLPGSAPVTGARAFRCIFFQKDAAAIATSAMPANKVRRSRHGFTSHHVFQAPQQAPACRIPCALSELDRTLRLTWPIHPAHPAGRSLLFRLGDCALFGYIAFHHIYFLRMQR
jgi:hypothetical protein